MEILGYNWLLVVVRASYKGRDCVFTVPRWGFVVALFWVCVALAVGLVCALIWA